MYQTGTVVGMSDCEGSFGGYDSSSVYTFKVGGSVYDRCSILYGGYIPYTGRCDYYRRARGYGTITSSLVENSTSSFTYLYRFVADGGIVGGDEMWQFSVDLSQPSITYDRKAFTVPAQIVRTDNKNHTVSVSTSTFLLVPTTPVAIFRQENIDVIKRRLLRDATSGLHTLPDVIDAPWGTLVKDAVRSIRYVSSNSIENVGGLADIKSNLPPIRTVKRLISKKDPAALAELYLWYKYSFAPNISDSKEIISAAARDKHRYTGSYYRSSAISVPCQAGGQTISVVCRASVKFAVSDYRDAQMRIASWGFDPGIAQGWDLIPFSFVVDWFFHVGDRLDIVDWEFDNFINTYHYQSLTYSTRSEKPVSLPSSLMGSITAIRYERTISRSIPFSYAIQSNTASSHILEGGALLVTNLCD